jgi:RecJ-like exonuclease
MLRTTKIAPTECPICEGMGYTPGGADQMRTSYNREHRAYVEVSTMRKGHGCEFCLGTGQVDEAERLIGLKQLGRRDEIRTVG